MKKLYFTLVIVLTLSSSYLSQSDKIKSYNKISNNPINDNELYKKANINFEYQLELFPGQVFNGWYYYWSNGGSAETGNFQINPPVSWLTISPTSFTSNSCSDIIPISYNFNAPIIPGIYTTSIEDLNGIWDDTEVTLSVTEQPSTAINLSYQVSNGQSISVFDTLYWNGFGPFGCQSNYIPGNTKLFSFREKDSVSWFRINPTDLIVPIFGEGVIESVITGDTTGNDLVYVITEAQYSHICFFYKIQRTVLTDVNENNNDIIITDFKLDQNYPNPFNPSTKISWQSPVGSHQTLKIYDVLGNEVATLIDEYRVSGNYEIDFDATGLSSGVYFYKLIVADYSSTKKMILMK